MGVDLLDAVVGNYALFLSEVKQDYDNAVKHYKKSLSIGSLRLKLLKHGITRCV